MYYLRMHWTKESLPGKKMLLKETKEDNRLSPMAKTLLQTENWK